MSQPDTDVVYVFTADGPADGEGPPGEAIRLPGRKAKADSVDGSSLVDRFGRYAELADKMMKKADETMAGTQESFRVEEITLHLGVSSEVGLAFIGQAGVEAAIDVVLRRK